jgi:predicted HAD superfamily Cof-like phosphohydrolase
MINQDVMLIEDIQEVVQSVVDKIDPEQLLPLLEYVKTMYETSEREFMGQTDFDLRTLISDFLPLAVQLGTIVPHEDEESNTVISELMIQMYRLGAAAQRARSNFHKVNQFHHVNEIVDPDNPDLGTPERRKLRLDLIDEERDELKEAMAEGDVVGTADALADLLYVTYGAALAFGMDADALFAEVHRSNMTKLDEDGKPVRRADGKILKGPNFEEPDLRKILFKEDP